MADAGTAEFKTYVKWERQTARGRCPVIDFRVGKANWDIEERTSNTERRKTVYLG